MYQILLFTLLALANANICSNSPLTIAELQQIRTNALTSLATYNNPNNLIPLNNNLDSTCNLTNSATFSHCGWRLAFNQPCDDTVTCLQFMGDAGWWQGQVVTTNLAGFEARTDKHFDPTYSEAQLTQDHAVVWLGCTPPAAGDVLGFAFTKNIYANGNVSVLANLRNGAIGDSLTQQSLKVVSNDGTPYGGYALIVYASTQAVRDKILHAFATAQSSTSKYLSNASFNVDPFPAGLLNLGLYPQNDTLVFTSRVIYTSPSSTYASATNYASEVFADFPYVHLYPSNPIGGAVITNTPCLHPDLGSAGLDAAINMEAVQQNLVQPAFLYMGFSSPYYSNANNFFYYTSSLVEDNGVKWITQQRTGYWGTRDFLFYSSGPIPVRASLWDTLLICATNPSASGWTSAGSSPHATFWTLNIFNTTNNKRAATLLSTQATASWNPWNVGAFTDTNNIGWCEAFVPPAMGCGTFTSQGLPCTQGNSHFDGTVRIEYRVYGNPNTTVAPSRSMVTPPQFFLITF